MRGLNDEQAISATLLFVLNVAFWIGVLVAMLFAVWCAWLFAYFEGMTAYPPPLISEDGLMTLWAGKDWLWYKVRYWQ